jgi:hypothetical protein
VCTSHSICSSSMLCLAIPFRRILVWRILN